jgi:peptidylprolyl isomerase/FKBP-type peptidyl-prolyl cis-trans isomerase FkpA
MSRFLIVSVLAGLLLCARGEAAPAPAPKDKKPGKVVTRPSGLKVEDLRIGEGTAAAPGHQIEVHYTGWVVGGAQFDSSRDRARPFTFRLGTGHVIKGWEEGLVGMKVGGKRKLTIPPALGYGERGAGGVVPPNATLGFEVELLKIER